MSVADKAVFEMTDGEGVFTLPGFLDRKTCSDLMSLIESFEPDDLGSVRCLLDKSEDFQKMAMSNDIEEICLSLFGTDYRLSALGARILPPNSKAGNEHSHVTSVHVDYPYRAVLRNTSGKASKFFGAPLGLQVLIPLVDLDLDNGATAYLPNSHKRYTLPDVGEFEAKLKSGEVKRLRISAGTMACWSGPLWHCAMPNNSDRNRGVVTLLFSPPFINHPHLMRANYTKEWLDTLPDKLKRLLSMNDFTAMVFDHPRKRIASNG